jgi:hypothetical protein
MPGHTDCTRGNLRINREVSTAHSSNVCKEASTAHSCNVGILVGCALACNVEKARNFFYLFTVK